MDNNQHIPRYAREDAVSILKHDIQLFLMELQARKEIDSFTFINEELSQSAEVVNVRVRLDTYGHQEIQYTFSFLHRGGENEEPVIVTGKSRYVSVLINRNHGKISFLKKVFSSNIQMRYRGYHLEDIVLDKVSEYIKDHPEGFLKSIKKTEHEIDRGGVDFEIGVGYKKGVETILVDCTNNRRTKHRGTNSEIVIIEIKSGLLTRSDLLIKKIKTCIKNHLRER